MGAVAALEAEIVVDQPAGDSVAAALTPADRVRLLRRRARLRASAEAVAAATEGTAQVFAATVDGGKSEQLRTRTGGRVKTVEANDGDNVVKGQSLITFESGSDPAEIATLQDRIASLENAEDDEAKLELKQAKQKLAAIEGGQKAQPIVAGLDGKLSGFNVVVGTVLRANEVVGKVADGEVPTRVRITVTKGTKIAKGQIVQLVLRAGGTAEGSVIAVTGKSVVVDTGTEPGDGIESVKF